MEVESSSSTGLIKDRLRIRSEGGQLKEDSVIGSRLKTSTRRKTNQSDKTSALVIYDNRRQEKHVKPCGSSSTLSVDTACYSAQKRQKLNLKNYGDYQPDGFPSTDCQQLPQRTSPQTNSRKSLTINRKQSMKSDLTEETSGSSKSRRSCNVESDRNVIKVPVQHGTKLKGALILPDSKVIKNSEKQIKQNATHCHEKLLNRKENEIMDHESEGKKKTWSGSVVPPSHKTVLRNENTGEQVRHKKLQQRRSPKVHSPSHKSKDVCSKPSSLQQKSR